MAGYCPWHAQIVHPLFLTKEQCLEGFFLHQHPVAKVRHSFAELLVYNWIPCRINRNIKCLLIDFILRIEEDIPLTRALFVSDAVNIFDKYAISFTVKLLQ